jgi:hypothetical protein
MVGAATMIEAFYLALQRFPENRMLKQSLKLGLSGVVVFLDVPPSTLERFENSSSAHPGFARGTRSGALCDSSLWHSEPRAFQVVLYPKCPSDVITYLKDLGNSFHRGSEKSFLELYHDVSKIDAHWRSVHPARPGSSSGSGSGTGAGATCAFSDWQAQMCAADAV